jgi:hypothetical protein
LLLLLPPLLSRDDGPTIARWASHDGQCHPAAAAPPPPPRRRARGAAPPPQPRRRRRRRV